DFYKRDEKACQVAAAFVGVGKDETHAYGWKECKSPEFVLHTANFEFGSDNSEGISLEKDNQIDSIIRIEDEECDTFQITVENLLPNINSEFVHEHSDDKIKEEQLEVLESNESCQQNVLLDFVGRKIDGSNDVESVGVEKMKDEGDVVVFPMCCNQVLRLYEIEVKKRVWFDTSSEVLDMSPFPFIERVGSNYEKGLAWLIFLLFSL
ncbi:LOW QUALITY PROTEIN: hypothetical protein PanWU01x14_253330, partial [Parasponia andersonii]